MRIGFVNRKGSGADRVGGGATAAANNKDNCKGQSLRFADILYRVLGQGTR